MRRFKRSCAAAAVLAALLAAEASAQSSAQSATRAAAVFAGGCFWSIEKAFEDMPGVVEAVSGYAGGRNPRPTYDNHEGALEAVRVTYDLRRISYRQLVDAYWRHVDPTDDGGQFCDRGPSYRTTVYVPSGGDLPAAEASRDAAQQALGRRVVTPLVTRSVRFVPAEAYHQDYARRNPTRYALYRTGCGRDRALSAVWSGR